MRVVVEPQPFQQLAVTELRRNCPADARVRVEPQILKLVELALVRLHPSYADGFRGKNDLRIVMRPNALRLMWSGILDLLVEGWPKDAFAVLQSGAALSNREAILDKVEAVCPAVSLPSRADYCPQLRQTVQEWWPLASKSH